MRLRERTSIAFLALLVVLVAAAPAQAQTGFSSEIVVRAWNVPDYSAGGVGVDDLQHESDSDWVPVFGGYFDQRAIARARASATAGTMGAAGYGSVRLNPLCDPCSASTPTFASGVARFWDTFTIGPGGGFDEGDAVQVRVLARLVGDVFLTGTPSDGSEWWFNVYFGPSLGRASDNLVQIEPYSGGLLPPKDEGVGPMLWDRRVDVTVGQKYYLWAELRAAQGGSGFYGYPIGTYTNYVDFYGTGTSGLGYASGYEGISIVSSAGASIAPVPEPATTMLMVAGLGVLGAVAVRRRGAA